MQNLHLLGFLTETFRRHVHHYLPPETPSTDNGGHGTERLLLKTQVSEDFK